MRCARCGRTVAGLVPRCPACGAGVSLGVLTPPPVGSGAGPPESGEQETILPVGDAPTIVPGSHHAILSVGDQPTILSSGDQTLIGPSEQKTLLQVPGAARRSGFDKPVTKGAPTSARADEGPLCVGQAFGARYHIIRLLGVGGMGAVYQAWDAELGVAVAIKVIRPEVTADPKHAADVERRFKRELVLARQVTHKNVVRIHDLGEIDGIKYITMPYIEGDDLATVIKQQGKLSVQKALRITRSIVSGLVAAHAAGVVHRDLKPANIMIDVLEEASIMDFGIARSTGAPVGGRVPGADTIVSNIRQAAASVPDATVHGVVVGTVEYMAPEQARGVAVDQRADVYALGLILYDMLVGRSRAQFAGNAIVELQARMAKAPPPVKSLVPEVPEALNHLISRCLEPDPEKRFQTTVELATALDRLDADGEATRIKRVVGLPIVLAVVSIALVLLASTWYFARQAVVPEEHPAMSVLIADFDNRANDPVFERSLEQALAIAMEGASFVTTFPREEAQKIVAKLNAGNRLDENAARLVSSSEGINVILAGAIEPKGSGYTISVRAIDPADGKRLGEASAAAGNKGDVLKAVGSVASKLRGTLGDAAPESEKLAAAETVSTSSLEALADYSRAQDLLFNLKDAEAIPYYKRATERDANFGRAYAAWATAATNLGRHAEAAELWKKALPLLERMTEREKYRTLATYNLNVTQNYHQAAESYKYLLSKYPYDRVGHLNLALTYFYLRDFKGAIEEGKRSIEVDPKSLIGHSNYALYAMYAGDFKTAADEAGKVIALDPTTFKAYLPFAIAGLAAGDVAAANDAYERMAKTNPEGASLANIGLADLAMYQGRFADAAVMLKNRISEDQKSNDRAYAGTKHLMLAEAYEADGKSSLALAEVRAALTNGSQNEAVLVPAARLFLRLGKESEAAAIASGLNQRLEAQSRAYGNIIEGELAARRKRPVDAITLFRAASKLTDLWLARMDLGIAYVEAGHYAEGFAELDQCFKRRGEASAIFLDDLPSFRHLATLPYWLGRAQEGIGLVPASVENYKTYLQIRTAAGRDPLAADARRRLKTVGSTP
jgi:serine/threonine protein kinase/tetratricopeptide (TPR) repeat protein